MSELVKVFVWTIKTKLPYELLALATDNLWFYWFFDTVEHAFSPSLCDSTHESHKCKTCFYANKKINKETVIIKKKKKLNI